MKFNPQSIKNRIKSYTIETMKKIDLCHRLDYPREIWLYDNMRIGSCAKEPETVKWFENTRNGIILDIGANAGAYSLIGSLYAKQVFAFEPSVYNFGLLLRNITKNKAANVIPVYMALSNRKTTGNMLSEYNIPGCSRNSFEKTLWEPNYMHPCISTSVDCFCKEYNIKPTHIKLDVDGNELDILSGAVKTLKDVQSVIVEVELKNKEAFISFMEKNRFYVQSNDNMSYRYANYIFIKEAN